MLFFDKLMAAVRLIFSSRLAKTAAIALPLTMTACVSAVDYGKIQHSEYVADQRCDPAAVNRSAFVDKPFFFVTSRLPDCRTAEVKLINHRSERVRYGRFGARQESPDSKEKSTWAIPFALADETQWWDDLSKAMENGQGRILLYVHGFRETFFTSSRDVAQMARLTDFKGPVIQYSWPSQGMLFKYGVDETNMYWDERNFRNFLIKLARQPWTKEIVLISHSLGARLLIPAVEYVDQNSADADSSNISNIILASPDIDRQNFERDIAEEILSARRIKYDRRITIYVSSKDKALAVSRRIHGYPRLGSPFCFDPFEAADLKQKKLPQKCYVAQSKYTENLEKSGLSVVDTSAVSHGSSGHSDYLRAASACLDFAAVVNGERDRRTGRNPTHLPHVFTLPPLAKGAKPANRLICRRDLK